MSSVPVHTRSGGDNDPSTRPPGTGEFVTWSLPRERPRDRTGRARAWLCALAVTGALLGVAGGGYLLAAKLPFSTFEGRGASIPASPGAGRPAPPVAPGMAHH
jgi:hypothetical protein